MNLYEFTKLYPHRKAKFPKTKEGQDIYLWQLQPLLFCKTYTLEGKLKLQNKIIEIKKEINIAERYNFFNPQTEEINHDSEMVQI